MSSRERTIQAIIVSSLGVVIVSHMVSHACYLDCMLFCRPIELNIRHPVCYSSTCRYWFQLAVTISASHFHHVTSCAQCQPPESQDGTQLKTYADRRPSLALRLFCQLLTDERSRSSRPATYLQRSPRPLTKQDTIELPSHIAYRRSIR